MTLLKKACREQNLNFFSRQESLHYDEKLNFFSGLIASYLHQIITKKPLSDQKFTLCP